jgi:hypothetical protein
MVYPRSANRATSNRGVRGPLEQKLEFATVDPVALHEEADQGIVYQLGQEHPAKSITSLPGPRGSPSQFTPLGYSALSNPA